MSWDNVREAVPLYLKRFVHSNIRRIKRYFRLFHLETVEYDITDSSEALELYVHRRVEETAKWRRLAWRYGESWPAHDDEASWDKVSYYTGQEPEYKDVLTKAAIAKLRRSIRTERIARMDGYLKWITLGAPLVGAAGGVSILLGMR